MLPISRTFFLTHDDHLPHNNFASVARRCSDRLQIGMSDFLRRNPHPHGMFAQPCRGRAWRGAQGRGNGAGSWAVEPRCYRAENLKHVRDIAAVANSELLVNVREKLARVRNPVCPIARWHDHHGVSGPQEAIGA